MRSFVIAAVVLASLSSVSALPVSAPIAIPSAPLAAPNAPRARDGPNAPSAPIGVTLSASVLGKSKQTNIPRAQPDTTSFVTYVLESAPVPTPSVAAPVPPVNAPRDLPAPSAPISPSLVSPPSVSPPAVPRDDLTEAEDNTEDDTEDTTDEYISAPVSARSLPTPSVPSVPPQVSAPANVPRFYLEDAQGAASEPVFARSLPTPSVSAPVAAPSNIPRSQSEDADATVSVTLPSALPGSVQTPSVPSGPPNPPHVIIPTDAPAVPLPGPVPSGL